MPVPRLNRQAPPLKSSALAPIKGRPSAKGPQPAWRRIRARPGAVGVSDLSAACALLVERFNAMQVAVTDLQDSCRALEIGRAHV